MFQLLILDGRAHQRALEAGLCHLVLAAVEVFAGQELFGALFCGLGATLGLLAAVALF